MKKNLDKRCKNSLSLKSTEFEELNTAHTKSNNYNGISINIII